MSRAFGNRMLKQFVVAEPEIQVLCAVSIVEVDFLVVNGMIWKMESTAIFCSHSVGIILEQLFKYFIL